MKTHGDSRSLRRIAISPELSGMPSGDSESNVSDTEADEMEEHLRGLGYIE